MGVMLLKLLPYSPFEIPRTERLIVLESRLRRKSHGFMALRDYVDWLEQAGVKMPASRRTLHEDLSRYAAFCDDVEYGENAKMLQLNSRQTRDATVWLMGQAWVDSPLKPYLPSAVVRCLLLARSEGAEVHFNYRKLRNPGEAWTANPHWCIPLRLLPGSDAGYMEMFGRFGESYPISISRISARMEMTDRTLRDYPPLPTQKKVRLILKTQDKQLLERLEIQFKGFVKQDRETLCLELEENLLRMTEDMLIAHLSRTRTAQRTVEKFKHFPHVKIFYE